MELTISTSASSQLIGNTTGKYYFLNGATSGSFTFMPNAAVDRALKYAARLYANNIPRFWLYLRFHCASDSYDPANSLSASFVAADPFAPTHVLTVCVSRCNFTSLGGAITNANPQGWDFV